jgi:hypothetical protein
MCTFLYPVTILQVLYIMIFFSTKFYQIKEIQYVHNSNFFPHDC